MPAKIVQWAEYENYEPAEWQKSESRVSEELKSKSVIFFAPNLALVRQSISNWTAHCNDPFVYLAVCSDQTVSGDTDEFTINSDELDIAVTTNADDIRNYTPKQVIKY